MGDELDEIWDNLQDALTNLEALSVEIEDAINTIEETNTTTTLENEGIEPNSVLPTKDWLRQLSNLDTLLQEIQDRIDELRKLRDQKL